jgi:hypothetical protein
MTVRVADLPATCEYQGAEGCATWEGYVVADEDAFRGYLGGAVANRLRDAEGGETFEEELQGLATTEFATEFLEDFLRAVPEEKSWEVGEALAETVLEEDETREVVWPWNTARDRRTPQASLQGADLVGFCRDGHGVTLLFGEVKTSRDKRSPPEVMHGRSGMSWQLESNATRLDVQHALLRWLRFRCSTPALRELYREAVQRYLHSGGQEVLIVGVLLRDTRCTERDVESRARHLASRLAAPVRVEILAWYMPVPIDDWHSALGGAA